MLETIKENPIIALVVILVPAITVAWKVLHVLYVKPRDFRISSLEKHVEQLRNEMISATQPKPPIKARTEFHSEIKEIDEERENIEKKELDPLTSLDDFHSLWKKKPQTELQRKDFEEKYKGIEVTWTAYIDSIDKSEYNISVYASTKNDAYDRNQVCVHLELKEEAKLLHFQAGEKIEIDGRISDYFLFPILEPATIKKSKA